MARKNIYIIGSSTDSKNDVFTVLFANAEIATISRHEKKFLCKRAFWSQPSILLWNSMNFADSTKLFEEFPPNVILLTISLEKSKFDLSLSRARSFLDQLQNQFNISNSQIIIVGVKRDPIKLMDYSRWDVVCQSFPEIHASGNAKLFSMVMPQTIDNLRFHLVTKIPELKELQQQCESNNAGSLSPCSLPLPALNSSGFRSFLNPNSSQKQSLELPLPALESTGDGPSSSQEQSSESLQKVRFPFSQCSSFSQERSTGALQRVRCSPLHSSLNSHGKESDKDASPKSKDLST